MRQRLVLAGRARLWRVSAVVAVAAVSAGLINPTPALARPTGGHRPKPITHEKLAKAHKLTARPRATPTRAPAPKPVPAPAWPKPGTVEVTVPAQGGKPVRAGSLPVWIAAAGERPGTALRGGQGRGGSVAKARRVRVRVLDAAAARDAGSNTPLISVARTDAAEAGGVAVRVDYGGFGRDFGGAYGQRLRLVQLPDCVLSTPARADCRAPRPLPAQNDTEHQTLSADVQAGPAQAAGSTRTSAASAGATVLALASGSWGDQGDYRASSMSPSSSWSVGTSTGEFTWSYPLRVPPAPGGLEPQLAINYNSSGVDGRTANTNSQSSWLGDGFDLWPGFVERSYKSCEDDGAPKDEWGVAPGDLCWGYDNATLSLNGHSGELVPISDGNYRLKNDDGTRIERLTGTQTDTANGDNDNEYWKVTTTDGVQYYFGKHRLPGWQAGKPETDSTWTVPVFGNNASEPCHADAFKDSSCSQAYRWNLDYVVDTSKNAIAYYYAKEKNYYGRNLKASDETAYVRGGYLSRVEYGLRSDALWPSKAPARVDFQVAERCLPNGTFTCDPAKIDTERAQWEDTPWDLNCKSGQDCKDNHGTLSPTFWTRQRLVKITTSVIKEDGSDWRPVDSWSLDHQWGEADPERSLLLHSIQQTGLAATPSVALPKVTFAYQDGPNRVDKNGDNTGPFIKYRLSGVSDESGGQTDIGYKPIECTATALPTPSSNTKRCFPSYWVHNSGEDPTIDWFHKYVVDSVQTMDRTGLAPNMVTTYDYKGTPAWHYDDDDGLTKEKYKTWSQWRGYDHVSVRTGGTDDPRTQADHYFLRGLDGDRATPQGGTRDSQVDDREGTTLTDHNALAGFEYRTEVYDHPGGSIVTKSVSAPWRYQTASRTRSWGTVTANLTGTATTRQFTALDSGWRETRVNNTFDTDGKGGTDTPIGRVTMSEDLGDVAKDDDDRCTRITYKDNTKDWLLAFANRQETVAVKCLVTPDKRTRADGQPGQVISDVRTSFDGHGWNVAPTAGDVTLSERLTAHDGTNPTYKKVSASEYNDTYGRPTKVTDAQGNATLTSYVDTQGITTQTTVTSPRVNPDDAASALTTVTDYDTAWGRPLTKTDAAGKRTDTVYDALGRLTKAWLPDRSKARNMTPNLEYSYQVEEGKIIAVGARTLTATGTQKPPTYELFDGLLRPRQSQVAGPGGNKIVAETLYDNRGQAERQYAPYYEEGAPSPDLWGVTKPGAVETQTKNTYDGLGRVTKQALINGGGDGQELWATTYKYGGDWTSVTPPKGATPTISYTNARGQTTERRQYHADTPTGDDYDVTRYTYAPGGQIATLTGPVNTKINNPGKTWTTYYDQVGRKKKVDDPDKGSTSFGYDDVDRLTETTDARGQKVKTNYDALGRVTSTTDGADTVLTSNVYDTLAKGQLTSSTRKAKDRNGNLADYTTSVTSYDNLYRPNGTTLTVPASEGVGTSFTFTNSYNADGTLKSAGMPAAGDLPAEVVTPAYDDLARPTTLSSNLSSYVTKSVYSPTSKPLQYELGTGAKKTWLSYDYQAVTQRVSRFGVTRQDVTGLSDRDATYKYDDAGNILQVADVSPAGQDTQCFRYDRLQRLSEAWAQSGADCPTDSTSTPTLGGPAPYRVSYAYTADGNRADETQYYKDSNGALQTATRHYTYAGDSDTAGYNGHQLAGVTQTGTSPFSNTETKESYSYDKTGNTATRSLEYLDAVTKTAKTRSQTFTYDTEGEIASIDQTETGKPNQGTSFVYDTEGARLIRRDTSGVTLYLPGMEVKLPAGAAQPVTTRYYAFGGQTIATRTSAGVSFLASDHQGTGLLTIGAGDQKIAQRRTTPFGQERSNTGTWPAAYDKGFVGGTKDDTGLTQLGAREYDPNTGRFITVDPVFNAVSPQSWAGYTYADNSPITFSDPTGLNRDPCSGDCNNNASDGAKLGGGSGDSGGGGGGGNTSTAPAHKPWYKVWWNHTVDAFNGWVDGAIDSIVNLPQQIASSMQGMSAAGPCATGTSSSACSVVAKTSEGPKPVHIPLGGDTHSKTYKVFKVVGEITGIPMPGAGGVGAVRGIRAATKAPRAIKALSLALRTGIARRALAEAECFPAGTKVATSRGLVPIERIKVGDKVWSRDPATGKNTLQKVTQLFRHTAERLVVLSAAGHQIKVTPGHRIWIAGRGWVTADDIHKGDRLLQIDGRTAAITAIGTIVSSIPVYNFEVQKTHTYFVTTGARPVLVHNICKEFAFKVMRELGPRPNNKGPTKGRIFDVDENELAPGMMSGTDPESADINKFLTKSPHISNPRSGDHPSITHVETKYAWMMAHNEITDADVVINNANGVCPLPFGCSAAVEAILPQKSTMRVWYPGESKPKILEGRA